MRPEDQGPIVRGCVGPVQPERDLRIRVPERPGSGQGTAGQGIVLRRGGGHGSESQPGGTPGGPGFLYPRDKGLVTPAFGFGAQVALVEVDQETGLVEVKQMWTAHDCGTVINPRAVEGQLAGSIQMGLGYALSEQFVMDGGQTLNANFLDYKMPNALDMPPSEVVHVDTYEPEGPLGAKECGEGLASPTAPAISDAVYHATGYRCRDLPITPEKILQGLQKGKKPAGTKESL